MPALEDLVVTTVGVGDGDGVGVGVGDGDGDGDGGGDGDGDGDGDGERRTETETAAETEIWRSWIEGGRSAPRGRLLGSFFRARSWGLQTWGGLQLH